MATGDEGEAARALFRRAERAAAARNWAGAAGHLSRLLARRAPGLRGPALHLLGCCYARLGQAAGAAECLGRARAWFARRGGGEAAEACRREQAAAWLAAGRPEEAAPLLAEGLAYWRRSGGGLPARAGLHLEAAALALAAGNPQAAVQQAFAALEAAGAAGHQRLPLEARANLMLARCALAQGRPAEALSFALAARVSAIDGRAYPLEWDAAELLFQLLRDHGQSLAEVDGELAARGVDLCDYISEESYRRILGAQEPPG